MSNEAYINTHIPETNNSPGIKFKNLEYENNIQINIINQRSETGRSDLLDQERIPNTNRQLESNSQDRNPSRNDYSLSRPWISMILFFKIDGLFANLVIRIAHSQTMIIMINCYLIISVICILLSSFYLLIKVSAVFYPDEIFILIINLIFGFLLLCCNFTQISESNVHDYRTLFSYLFYLPLSLIFYFISYMPRRIAQNNESLSYLGMNIGLFIYESIVFTSLSILYIAPRLLLLVFLGFESLIRLIICKWSDPCDINVSQAFLTDVVLEKSIYHKWNANIICTICLGEINDQQEICQLKCHRSHLFHYICLEMWSKTNNVCPNCRQPIQSNYI